MTTQTAKRHKRRPLNLAIPDAAIGLYFGLFPLLVATFLSVQVVRAQSVDEHLLIPVNYPVMGVAR